MTDVLGGMRIGGVDGVLITADTPFEGDGVPAWKRREAEMARENLERARACAVTDPAPVCQECGFEKPIVYRNEEAGLYDLCNSCASPEKGIRVEPVMVATANEMEDADFIRHFNKRHEDSLGGQKELPLRHTDPLVLVTYRTFHARLHETRVGLGHWHMGEGFYGEADISASGTVDVPLPGDDLPPAPPEPDPRQPPPGSSACLCPACLEYFSSTSAFDKHQVSNYDDDDCPVLCRYPPDCGLVLRERETRGGEVWSFWGYPSDPNRTFPPGKQAAK